MVSWPPGLGDTMKIPFSKMRRRDGAGLMNREDRGALRSNSKFSFGLLSLRGHGLLVERDGRVGHTDLKLREIWTGAREMVTANGY